MKLINNNILPGYTASKILWLRKNEPELYGKVNKILNPKDYIRFRLTGEFATDVSDASGTGLFDVRKRKWSEQLLKILNITVDILPEVYESTDITGYINNVAANEIGIPKGIPVIAGGGDSVIYPLGIGTIEENTVSCHLGNSAGIVSINTGSFIHNKANNLQFLCSYKSDLWCYMGVSLSATGAYKWFVKNLRFIII